MFLSQFRIRFPPRPENCFFNKSGPDFSFFLVAIWGLNVRWFIGVYTGVSMISPFIRKNTGPVFFWTPIFVPLMIWSQLENVTFDSDDWNRLLYNRRAHTQMCAPLLHICFPSRPSHTREHCGLQAGAECFCLGKVGLGHSSSSLVVLLLMLVIHRGSFWSLYGANELYGGG